jgi:hypothetical protein
MSQFGHQLNDIWEKSIDILEECIDISDESIEIIKETIDIIENGWLTLFENGSSQGHLPKMLPGRLCREGFSWFKAEYFL